MKKARYNLVRDSVWRTLIRAKTNSLPVNLFDICHSLNITLMSFEENIQLVKQLDKESEEAFVLKGIDRNFYIFYNNEILPYGRLRFNVAHEIAHIVLKHTSIPFYEENSDFEIEANTFASKLLAPAVVLHYCEATTVADIAVLCEMSFKAAKNKEKYLKKIIPLNRFKTSKLEQMVYNNFLNFIENYNKTN